MTDHQWGFATKAVHAGSQPDPTTGARAVPIYQSTSFVFEDTRDAADLFALQKYGTIYSRISNPTVNAFEERMAALEGGIGAVATASGQAAEFLTVAGLCDAGDHLVASSNLYGGTITQFDVTLRRLGIETTFVPADDPAAYRRRHHAAHEAAVQRGRGQPLRRGRRPRGAGRRRPVPPAAPGARRHHRLALAVPAPRVGRGRRASTPPPSSSAGTAPRSAASSSRPGASTGATAASPTSPSRSPPTAACASGRTSASTRSAPSCGSSSCVTSAPRSAPSTRSCCCRASRPCRCGWRRTSATR